MMNLDKRVASLVEKGASRHDIMHILDGWAAQAEDRARRAARNGKMSPMARNAQWRFVERVGRILYYLHHGKAPLTATVYDLRLYQVLEPLLSWPPTVLDFDAPDNTVGSAAAEADGGMRLTAQRDSWRRAPQEPKIRMLTPEECIVRAWECADRAMQADDPELKERYSTLAEAYRALGERTLHCTKKNLDHVLKADDAAGRVS